MNNMKKKKRTKHECKWIEKTVYEKNSLIAIGVSRICEICGKSQFCSENEDLPIWATIDPR